MNKFAFTLLCVGLMVNVAKAQQDPQFTYFTYTYMDINPGYAGSQDKICATILARNQYIGGFNGAEPATVNVNANMPFRLFGKSHGVGLSISRDEIGFFADNYVKLGYAYRANMGDGKLGIGIGAGFFQHNLNNPNWRTPGDDVPTGNSSAGSDPAIPGETEENFFKADLYAGLFYQADNIFFGLSATHINRPLIEYLDNEGTNTGAVLPKEYHYYLTAGYNFQLANPSFEVSPSVLIKSDGVSAQFDLNTILTYNKTIWGGVNLRIPEASLLGGITLANNLKIGLAYDITLSKLLSYNSGSVEFLVNYCFEINRDKVPQRYKSIRYL